MTRIELKVLAAALPLLFLAACNGTGSKTASGYPATSGGAGTFIDTAVSSYTQSYMDVSKAVPNPNQIADAFAAAMQNTGWTRAAWGRDTDVTASALTGALLNADVVWFSGHGDDGVLALTGYDTSGVPNDQRCWGPGPNAGATCSSAPYQGASKAKWLFTYASSAASAPQSQWPGRPDFTANYLPFFVGPLRGIYGFWQGPGTCAVGGFAFDKTRSCDISTGTGVTFAQKLVSRMINNSAQQTVHQAWISAAMDANVGGKWSMWEDGNAFSDYVSSDAQSNNLGLSGVIWWYYASNVAGTVVGSAPVHADTFTLQPITLVPESVDDGTMLNQLSSSSAGGASTYQNNGTYSSASKDNAYAEHVLSTGALTYTGVMQINPVGFSQTTAYNSAVTAVQNTKGMPGDATLSTVNAMYRVSPYDGTAIQTGFEFVWKHAAISTGSDAIRVLVDDVQIPQNQCVAYDYWYDDRGRPHQYCSDYETVMTDQPNISYMFRMWRSTGSARHTLGEGQTSIDAYTASQSLPAGTQVVSYGAGYWTGGANDNSGNIGVPAWVFQYSGGGQGYVDAYTGQFIASTAE